MGSSLTAEAGHGAQDPGTGGILLCGHRPCHLLLAGLHPEGRGRTSLPWLTMSSRMQSLLE